MDWKKYKSEITSIVELIEDKDFPARRNITDYIEQMFGYPKEMAEFIQSEYDRLSEDLTGESKK